MANKQNATASIQTTTTFDHRHYVPILKWRQGEYQALFRLEADVKGSLTPLLEIPTEAWDFENDAPAKSLDEHLEPFGKRLKAKWGHRRCFVDSCYLDARATVSNGQHHLEWIFNLARENKCTAVPVTGLNRHKDYVSAVRNIVSVDQRGLCLRLTAKDIKVQGLHNKISALLTTLDVRAAQTDLVIDCGSILDRSPEEYAADLKYLLERLPSISKWRTLTVAGTAFPSALPSAQFRPAGKASRCEWIGYKLLCANLAHNDRIPAFGDYVVSHPNTERIDPRLIDPLAKIKYSIHDEWFLAVGHKVKETGRDQYVNLCDRIIKASPSVYAGAAFSWGDNYIHECANKIVGTGGSSTWPCVGSNHHMTRVVRDISSLSEL